MKKRKARKLEPCAAEFYNEHEAAMFDLLLSRAIGQKMFFRRIIKKSSGMRYRFLFWATEAEQESIYSAWDKVVQVKWDGVEEAILETL